MRKRPRKLTYIQPEDKKGTRCSLCGQVFSVPRGYSYPDYSEMSYDSADHPVKDDCIKYLKEELKDVKSTLQQLEDKVRDIERNSRTYDEYH